MDFNEENIKKVLPDVVRQSSFDQLAFLLVYDAKNGGYDASIKKISEALESAYQKGKNNL